MKAAADNTAETARRIRLAGYQRLLSHIHVDPPVLDQTHLMKLAERRVHDYTKSLTTAQTREGKTVLEAVTGLLKPFDFRVKPSYLGLWEFVLCGTGSPELVKTHLEALQSVSFNNRMKRLIPPQLQTIAKYTGIVKHILNFGKPFSSLFDEVDLSKSEAIQRELAKGKDLDTRVAVEALLEGQNFEGDENLFAQTFYEHVDSLSDPVLRNTYFNRVLLLLVPRLEGSTRLTSLFAQLYCHLIHKELVPDVDPRVKKAAEMIDFFSHSMRHMGLLLEPHSNLKKQRLVLDEWQRGCCRAIRNGQNVLVSAPPSAGKTFASTEVINAYDNAWYVVPTKPLADQLAGILLATLEDNEKRKGVAQRNLRLELEDAIPYRRFKRAKDNLVVATPIRLWNLIREMSILPTYIILDEFHNISCPVLGPYYEALFLFAAFHGIRVVALTGTMKPTDFDPIKTWFERVLTQPLFSVQIQKRFFNQRRVVFRVTDGRVSVATLDPLDHLLSETVRSPTFRHPGLVPAAVLRLYNKLPSFPRIDERIPVLPTLDDVDALEGRLFHHVAAQPDAVLADLLKELPVSSQALTMDQIHTTLCAMDAQWKPLLFFKIDPHACMTFFLKFVSFIQDKNRLVYGNFQDDQPLVTAYLEEVADMNAAERDVEKEEEGEKAVAKAELRRVRWEALYLTKYLPKLVKFYKEYQEPVEDVAGIEAFNAKYKASLTHEYILTKRAGHVAKQLAKKYDTVRLRKNYEIHDDMKISTYSASAIMKDIRDQFNEELAHHRKQNGPQGSLREGGPFKPMEAEFDALNEIEETRTWKKAMPTKKGEEEVSAKKPYTETRRMGRPWSSCASPPGDEDDESWVYSYNISYTNPVMVAAECGVLFYNELLNPALSYICQLLISTHPLVLIADRTLTSGINYPFKSAWFQGSDYGEPPEVLDNTTAFQGMGRAGRRGLEKEATIITNGVDIPSILTPCYTSVTRNTADRMAKLLYSEELRVFALTGERTAPVALAGGAGVVPALAGGAGVVPALAGGAGVVPVTVPATVPAAAVELTGTWEDLALD
jgi:hypothetical protein